MPDQAAFQKRCDLRRDYIAHLSEAIERFRLLADEHQRCIDRRDAWIVLGEQEKAATHYLFGLHG